MKSVYNFRENYSDYIRFRKQLEQEMAKWRKESADLDLEAFYPEAHFLGTVRSLKDRKLCKNDFYMPCKGDCYSFYLDYVTVRDSKHEKIVFVKMSEDYHRYQFFSRRKKVSDTNFGRAKCILDNLSFSKYVKNINKFNRMSLSEILEGRFDLRNWLGEVFFEK